MLVVDAVVWVRKGIWVFATPESQEVI